MVDKEEWLSGTCFKPSCSDTVSSDSATFGSAALQVKKGFQNLLKDSLKLNAKQKV